MVKKNIIEVIVIGILMWVISAAVNAAIQIGVRLLALPLNIGIQMTKITSSNVTAIIAAFAGVFGILIIIGILAALISLLVKEFTLSFIYYLWKKSKAKIEAISKLNEFKKAG